MFKNYKAEYLLADESRDFWKMKYEDLLSRPVIDPVDQSADCFREVMNYFAAAEPKIFTVWNGENPPNGYCAQKAAIIDHILTFYNEIPKSYDRWNGLSCSKEVVAQVAEWTSWKVDTE